MHLNILIAGSEEGLAIPVLTDHKNVHTSRIIETIREEDIIEVGFEEKKVLKIRSVHLHTVSVIMYVSINLTSYRLKISREFPETSTF